MVKVRLAAEEKRNEDEKELGAFIKGGLAFKLVPPSAEGRKAVRGRGKSQTRADPTETSLAARSDSAEPRLARDIKMQRFARAKLMQHAVRSMLLTDETERVVHEHRVCDAIENAGSLCAGMAPR